MTESNLDYYKILGLIPSATFEEIKLKYRELAIKFHPDKMKSSLAEVMMKQINEAYDVLSDPIKRATYDKSNMYNEIKSETGSRNKKSKQFNDVLDKLAKYGKLLYKGIVMFSNGINKFFKEMNKFSQSASSQSTSQNETSHTSKTHATYNNPSRKSVKQVHVYHHYDDDDDYDKDTQIPNKTYEQNRKFAENLFSNNDSNKTIEYDDYGYNVENIYDTDYDKLETKRRKAKHTNTDDYGFNVDDVFDL